MDINMMRKILPVRFILICAGLAAAAGVWLGRRTVSECAEARKLAELQEKFSRLSEVDIDEYLRLRTLEERK